MPLCSWNERNWAKVFDKETTDIVTKTDGDYTVSLLGMVSGGQLDAFDLNAEDAAKRNYVALAVQRSDGKPIEDYDKPGISVSPLIEGFDPMRWNAAAFDNKWEKQIVDGVLTTLQTGLYRDVWLSKDVHRSNGRQFSAVESTFSLQ